jgi:hypothetical protein
MAERPEDEERAMTIQGRREFLRGLGISVPAVVTAGTDYGAGIAAPAQAMTAEEVFTLFVSEAMHQLSLRRMATDKFSTNRLFFEVQGAALALVLSQLQQRQDDGR